MFGVGPQELLVVLIVGLLVLGPKRLPEIARSLGKGLAEFRRASSDLRQSLALDDEPRRHAPPAKPPAQAAHAELGANDDAAEGRTIAESEAPPSSEPDRTGGSNAPADEK